MGNATLGSATLGSAVLEDGVAFGGNMHRTQAPRPGPGPDSAAPAQPAFDGTSALKYHPSFYGAAPQAPAPSHIPPVARGVEGTMWVRTTPRRTDGDTDRSRPGGGTFEYRNRVGVSQVGHEARTEDVTWRSMLLGVVLTAAAVLGLVGIGALSVGDATTSDDTAVVRVASGDTLTAIATKVSPDRPVWSVIEQIMNLNAMSTSALTVGQTLIVPAGQGR
ncbi:hypothetical protein ABH922_001681 [Rhodococcus sp. 27YEA15]|uniref:LysM peptidoglycan-binding domain-containing protein n=1 Tax=Rhodococcus sp. 27YEA15 TaxID=3156259 RepID=UPI003C79E30A